MTTHERIVANEVIERYVRRQLADDERHEFEEHLLDCGECFEHVQDMERFVAGIRRAAESGALQPARTPARLWFAPVLAWAFSLALIAALTGSGFWICNLRHSVVTLSRDLADTRTQLAAIANRPSPPELIAEGLPLAILDTSRAPSAGVELALPSSAREFALWIQLDPVSKTGPLEIRISGENGSMAETVHGLEKNQYGAVAVTLPASHFPPGVYTVRISSSDRALQGEYRVRITPK